MLNQSNWIPIIQYNFVSSLKIITLIITQPAISIQLKREIFCFHVHANLWTMKKRVTKFCFSPEKIKWNKLSYEKMPSKERGLNSRPIRLRYAIDWLTFVSFCLSRQMLDRVFVREGERATEKLAYWLSSIHLRIHFVSFSLAAVHRARCNKKLRYPRNITSDATGGNVQTYATPFSPHFFSSHPFCKFAIPFLNTYLVNVIRNNFLITVRLQLCCFSLNYKCWMFLSVNLGCHCLLI